MTVIIEVDRSARLRWPGHRAACALGRAGIVADKREGDGGTPAGLLPLRRVLYRADRVERPPTALPLARLGRADGWCDDPADPAYNRLVGLPHRARCEALWRDDGLYDVVVVLGHNDDPVVSGRGSAIFMHVAGPGYGATEGCVALALGDHPAAPGNGRRRRRAAGRRRAGRERRPGRNRRTVGAAAVSGEGTESGSRSRRSRPRGRGGGRRSPCRCGHGSPRTRRRSRSRRSCPC